MFNLLCFITGNLTYAMYLEMLQQIIPDVRLVQINFDLVWFQQDRAHLHYGWDVRTYLDNTFSILWKKRSYWVSWKVTWSNTIRLLCVGSH